MRPVHRTSATLASLLVFAAVPSVALADHLPDDNAALDQYVASLPEPDGDRPVDLNEGGNAKPLPRSVVRTLAAAPDGDALEEVATSVALGAPEEKPGDAGAPDRAQPGPAARAVPAAAVKPDEAPVSTVLGSAEGIIALILLAISLAVGFAIGRPGARRA
jgi:hypothetical protein